MSLDDGTLRLGPSGSEAKAICVFVHGRGQSPGEMQSRVVARLSAPSVTFVLPRAPRGAWWDARAVDPLTPVARAQLSDALDHLAAVVAAARAAAPRQPMLLAGFSQGACLAIEYLCAGLPPPDAVAALTGLPGRRSCGWTIRLRAGRDAGLPLRRRRRSVDSAVGLRGRGAIDGRAWREAAGRSVPGPRP
ncbi:MAG TPA: hypothetical protein VNY10_08435 [Roseiarcus sp.]|nr:hypothetical protein [Roseiarcus sp.]